MQELRKCKICGNMFVAKSRVNVTCSKKCRTVNNRLNQDKGRRARNRAAAEKNMKLGEINEKAREMGLTYGQYMAQQYMREHGI